MSKEGTFLDLLMAGMLDAATSRKLTQLKTTITPEGKVNPEIVRIIIIPEKMDHEFPQGLDIQEERTTS